MLHFKEKMGSIYLMDEQEVVRYEVVEPAVLFDKEFFVIHKIGNRNDVLSYYNACIEKCKKTGTDLFESWILLDLPMDAEVLDKILNLTGYLETWIKEWNIPLDF